MYPSSSAEIRTTASTLLLVGAVILIPDTVYGLLSWAEGEAHPTGLEFMIGFIVALALSAWTLDRWRVPDGLFGVPVITLGVLITWILNVTTRDGSLGALVAPILPLTYAVYHLRRRLAVVMVALVVSCQVQTALTYGTSGREGRDALMLIMIEGAFCWFIIRARQHQQELQVELVQRAEADPLTGLASRRVVEERLAELPSQPEPGCAMVILDLDAFKAINDTHGHPVGDQVLVAVAHRLRAAVRASDLAGRLGGDEFAILLPGCGRRDAMNRSQEIVRSIVAEPLVTAEGLVIPLALSAGVAHSDDVADVETLYRWADRSLYEAKRAGRPAR